MYVSIRENLNSVVVKSIELSNMHVFPLVKNSNRKMPNLMSHVLSYQENNS